jgi:hypothetical protein
MQQNEMVEMMKKQYQLFEQHLSVATGNKKPATTNSSNASTSSNNSSKPANGNKQYNNGNRPPWKGQKSGGKPFYKPKTAVNQVQDEAEAQPGEWEEEESGEVEYYEEVVETQE